MNSATQQPASFPIKQAPIPTRVKYCLYARKSTESEERQILSIDSQIKEMLQMAEREGLEVTEIKRESHSAKETGKRPVFNELIDEIRSGKFTGILTWAPDRISRNAGDLGRVVDLIDQKLLIEIRTYSQKFANNPNEKFLLMILGSQAKLENDNRAINVKRGLRTRCEMGLRPGMAPTGYLNEKRLDRRCHVMVDPERSHIIKKMFERVANEQWSGRKLHQWLKFELNFKTKGGKNLGLSNIYLILQNPFYYGVFEYPVKSGNWYNGQHTPLVTKDLFDKVQQQLKRAHIVKSEMKEFSFTKLLSCGLCGSGISADEKYKELKDGTTARYVYYGCTRARDLHCKCGYIREEELIKQLIPTMDELDINEIGMKHKFEQEVERLNKFQKGFFQKPVDLEPEEKIDVRSYAKYILKDGTTIEKRELLSCVRTKLLLTKGLLTLKEV